MTDSDMRASPAPSSQEAALAAEDEGYYHESALNATWTGSRLAVGGLAFLFGCFVFAYFYLRSLNSAGRWQGSGFVHPSQWMGTTIMLLAVLSAGTHYFVLQRIKAGHKQTWQVGGLIALGLGLAAVAMQVYMLANLPCKPAAPGTPANSSASTRSSWSSSSPRCSGWRCCSPGPGISRPSRSSNSRPRTLRPTWCSGSRPR